MKREAQLFLKLIKQLDEELEKSTDLFLKQRPFLTNPGMQPEILERSDDEIEEKITNDFTIQALVNKINSY